MFKRGLEELVAKGCMTELFLLFQSPESFPGVFTRVSEFIEWIEDVIIDDMYQEHFSEDNTTGDKKSPWDIFNIDV